MSRYEDILKDTINYIKFRNEYRPISLYGDEINFKAPGGPEPVAVYSSSYEQSRPDEPLYVKEAEPVQKTLIENVKDSAAAPKRKISENWTQAQNLEQLNEMIKDCQKCKLWKTRTNFVFGTGNPNADIVVVGEAPGADEDMQGKPFVGRAGQLLTKILAAINLERDEVFICNILKSRPPGNRNPEPDEIEACEPYLVKQLELINPKFILALGTFAAQTLLKTKMPLGKMRGRFHDYNGIKTMVTFHPAALLRNPGWKKPTWEDVQLLRNEYDKISGK